MNVAIITSEYYPHNNQGGIATFASALASLLVHQGHRVFVITTVSRSFNSKGRSDNPVIIPVATISQATGIRIIAASAPGKLLHRFLTKYFYTTTRLLVFAMASLVTFIRLQKKQRTDIIHAPVLFAPALFIRMLFFRTPLIAHAQGPDELLQPFDSVSTDTKIKAGIESLFMKQASVIIPCSRTICEYLKKRHMSIRNRLVYIPNFIDVSRFHLVSKIPDIHRLVFFGRLEFRKGPDLALKAFIALSRRYPKLTLTFIGEDTCSWKLHGKSVLFSAYLSACKLPPSIRKRIVFISRVDDRQKLLRHLEEHPGIAVLPSRYEPFGFVYIEAMAAGQITIASSEGGGGEILRNGVDGFTVYPTVENIRRQIDSIHKMRPRELVALIKNARSRILRYYNISSADRAYRALYKQIFTPHFRD